MIPDRKSPNPLARIAETLAGLQRQIDQIRSATGSLENATVGERGIDFRKTGAARFYDANDNLGLILESAGFEVIDPVTFSKMQIRNGRILMWDGADDNGTPGSIQVDQAAGRNTLRIFPPSDSGTGLENSITVQGRGESTAGNVWVYTDGGLQLSANTAFLTTPTSLTVDTGRAVILTGGELGLYELPTTSDPANLRLDTIGGKFTVGFVTSSQRYKQDIEDAAFDPREVLQLRPRTWRDKNEVEGDPQTTKRPVGFIAEEVHDLVSCRPLVELNSDGEPDGLKYDRFAAAHQSVLVHHDERIALLEAENADLRARLEALDARLEMLEA